MDQNKELTLEEMNYVIGGIKVNDTPCQICPKCNKPIPIKGFLRHLALCEGKDEKK